MNVATITMPRAEARKKYLEYRAGLRARPGTVNADDLAIMRGYREIAEGRQILHLLDVIRQAGVDEYGLPRLAVTRADLARCVFRMYSHGGGHFTGRYSAGWRDYAHVTLPAGTFSAQAAELSAQWSREHQHRSPVSTVPTIPPLYRPGETQFKRYHVLWEAEWRPAEVTRDPMLLRRLKGWLFVVLAAWDLTELERAVLAGR